MASASDARLYQLYFDFGTVQQQRNRPSEAADAFALALYYARRLGDTHRVSQCRELVLERNPNHLGAQPVSAPLFFAQLLMRYPVDEVEQALAFSTPANQMTASSTATFGETYRPESIAGVRPPMPNLAQDPSSTGNRTGIQIGPFEAHHVLNIRSQSIGSTHAEQPVTGTDDFLIEESGVLDHDDDFTARSVPTTLLDWLARGTIVFGVIVLTYLAAELYPRLRNIDTRQWVRSLSQEPSELLLVVDEEAEATTRKNNDVDIPKPSPVEALPKKLPPVIVAGANSSISLPEVPENNSESPPESAVRISKRNVDSAK